MKKPKKMMFVQDCGTYSNEILVLVGIQDKKDIFKYLKKINAKVNFSKWVLSDFDSWNERLKEKNKGLFCWNNEVEGSVLVLRSMEDTWDYWEVLAHEIHHIVFWLAKQKCFQEEMEAQAYLFDFLFRSLRRKISSIDKI